MGFLLPLINVAGWISDAIQKGFYFILTLIDGAVYSFVAYSFKIFQLMCTINFNSIYGIAKPLVDRLQSVIIVFVVFLIGKFFLESMLNPDKATEKGKQILINLFIATAMFIGYNFIFSIFNELNIAIIGSPTGYKYSTLSDVFDLNDENNNGKPDSGLIVRAIFGNADNDDIVDPGDTIALGLAGAFYRDLEGGKETGEYGELIGSVCLDNKCDFERLSKDMPQKIVDDRVKFTPIVGFAVALFVIYSMFSSSLKIGIRMFKLLILQMLFPIVAVDVIENGVKGKFKDFCSEYIRVFLDAIMRMATILIVTSFVSQFIVHINDYFPTLQNEEGAFTKLIITVLIVIAAYMFAGQAPEYINKNIFGGKGDVSGSKNFIGGLLGGAISGIAGFAGGLAGGGIGGAIAGLGSGALGGIKSGAKGNTVSELFKAGKGAKADAKALGANVRHVGGLSAYASSRVGEMFGVPQSYQEKAQRAEERQTSMEDMIKSLENGYDRQMYVTDDHGNALTDGKGNKIQVGVDRDKFNSYAYDKNNVNGFYHLLTGKTQAAVDKTNAAKAKLDNAQAEYEHAYQTGDKTAIQTAKAKLSAVNEEYSILKADSDKKVNTDFDKVMLADAKQGKNIKGRNKNEVDRSIENFDMLAERGYTTNDIVAGNVSTKDIKDHNTEVIDRNKNSVSASRFNNRNGGSGGN